VRYADRVVSRPSFVPGDALGALLANRYFWARIHGEHEDALEVTDESFDDFDALIAEHGVEETDDDFTTVSLYVPLPARCDAIRARLADAWIQTGLVAEDVAAQLAAESCKRRRETPWRTDARLGWATPEGYRRAGDSSDEDVPGWSDEHVETFRQFLAAIGGASR
jgi:hypothetical protein